MVCGERPRNCEVIPGKPWQHFDFGTGGDEPTEEKNRKAEVYRWAFRQTVPQPREGTSLQDLFDAVGPVEVLGLDEGHRFDNPPAS
mmetsp:Transcript_1797/g.6042  ORF Transcript_1797/g.6042 Transcript_1797/m.6042 type:complete len:86 (+) Transcript_1797:618-875(+)